MADAFRQIADGMRLQEPVSPEQACPWMRWVSKRRQTIGDLYVRSTTNNGYIQVPAFSLCWDVTDEPLR